MILLYHNVFDDTNPAEGGLIKIRTGLPLSAFREQISWLKRHRRIVRLSEYLDITEHGKQASAREVAITFDDGLADTFRNVTPTLLDWSVPATFFISTAHLNNGGPLWFSYVDALCFEGVYGALKVGDKLLPLSSMKERRQARRSIIVMARASGTPHVLHRELTGAYPLPSSVTDRYQGLSHEEMSSFAESDRLECGAHTVSHPYLDLLSRGEQAQEVFECKRQLAEMIGKPVRYFAYPSGDYDRETLSVVKEAGYEAAFATFPKHLEADGRFEIGRTGIYSASFTKFRLKMYGAAEITRRVGISK